MPRSRSTEACRGGSRVSASTLLSRSAAVSAMPASSAPRAAASVRWTRLPGSRDSVAARSRKADAAAIPPRAWARAAADSSSVATSSSGALLAWARCQARRSGAVTASVTSARALCTALRRWTSAPQYTEERARGWQKRTRVPNSTSPEPSATGQASATSMPDSWAAAQSRCGSPVGSAAARVSSRCAGSESPSNLVWKFRCRRCATAEGAVGTKPPALGSSIRASGLPRASLRRRSCTCVSRVVVFSAFRRERASELLSPPRVRPGSSSRRCSVARVANTMATGSAATRLPRNPSARVEARSSQCASSMTHSTGCRRAAVESSSRAAKPTRCGSGEPPARPNATRRMSR